MDIKQGQTIIIGMDGGIESAVAAYLLKKQGYQCIGISVVYLDNDEEFKPIFESFIPDDLEHIKSICRALEIPFYATNASEKFFYRVSKQIVSARLSGNRYEPQVDRTIVLLSTLIEKAKSFGSDVIATGHACKILKNHNTNMLNLYTTNDSREDDSYYLSKVPYEFLKHIYLPVSDLKKDEVLKISKLIPVEFRLDKEKRREDRLNIMKHEELYKYVHKHAAPSLRNDGLIMTYYDSSTLGDNEGIEKYFIGQPEFPIKNKPNLDKESVVSRIVPSQGMIYVDKRNKLFFNHCYLIKFSYEENLNRSLPIDAYAMISPRAELKKCKAYFKNNRCVSIYFKDDIEGLCPRGSYIVLYNKSGPGARVIGGGTVRYSGYFDDDTYRTLPKTKDEEEKVIEDKAKKKELGF